VFATTTDPDQKGHSQGEAYPVAPLAAGSGQRRVDDLHSRCSPAGPDRPGVRPGAPPPRSYRTLAAPRAVHDPAKILLDLAITVALGGDCAADIALLRSQPGVFGLVASDPTVSRVIDDLADAGAGR
jgi:hypothetical protein